MLVLIKALKYTRIIMRLLYVFLIFSFLFNPLSVESKGEDIGCADMHRVSVEVNDTSHDCCDDQQAMQLRISNVHECDTCQDCQAHCYSTCAVFNSELFDNGKQQNQQDDLFRLVHYPTPYIADLIPPIS